PCSYTSMTDTTFSGITGCTGTPDDNANVTGTSQQQANAGTTGDDKSKTADGDQSKSAALAVVVLISTTQAYLAPTDASSTHTIATAGGADTIHAGSMNNAATTADASNV